MNHRLQKQRGVALIVVMMVVALVVIIASSMGSRLQLQLQRQLNIQQRQQMLYLALGAEEFGRRTLQKSLQGKDTVNLGQPWAQEGATFPIEQATLTGRITDLQACFNLNSLRPARKPNEDGAAGDADQERSANGQNQNGETVQASGEGSSKDASTPPQPEVSAAPGGPAAKQTPAQKALQRLLEQSATDLSIPADYVVARIVDWIDADNDLQQSGGAEENDYAALPHPYYTANSFMVNKSELRTILDLTPGDYQLIAPLVCVIPGEGALKINVNTLKEEQASLIAGLVPGVDEETAKKALSARPSSGYDSVDAFFGELGGNAGSDAAIKTLFDVKSSYFQAEFTLETEDSSFVLTTIYKLDQNANPIVVSRRFGGSG